MRCADEIGDRLYTRGSAASHDLFGPLFLIGQQAEQMASSKPGRIGAVAPVEWTMISGEQAETLLSNLIYNEHPTAVRVRPSQGDLGIDVLIPVGEGGEPFDVRQINKFAENLGDSEKRQIKNSFRRFLVGVGRGKVPAADWYLVMPIDPTVNNYRT
jgi:hypothetical protein